MYCYHPDFEGLQVGRPLQHGEFVMIEGLEPQLGFQLGFHLVVLAKSHLRNKWLSEYGLGCVFPWVTITFQALKK
jgi:hypothetical protein